MSDWSTNERRARGRAARRLVPAAGIAAFVVLQPGPAALAQETLDERRAEALCAMPADDVLPEWSLCQPDDDSPIVGEVFEAAAKRAPAPKPAARRQTGLASYYADKFRGRKTASGLRYNPTHLTAAHRTLPLHSTVKVTNLANNRSVVVRITDRGPFAGGRIIDLSREAARRLGILKQGVARVAVQVLGGRGAPAGSRVAAAAP